MFLSLKIYCMVLWFFQNYIIQIQKYTSCVFDNKFTTISWFSQNYKVYPIKYRDFTKLVTNPEQFEFKM